MTTSPPSETIIRYYSGPERRLAEQPRRKQADRRHRKRTEALISDCRTGLSRRAEDEDGYIPVKNLYSPKPQSQNR